MLEHLKQALCHLTNAQKHCPPALSRSHYPILHQDINYAIQYITQSIATLQQTESITR